MIRLIINILCSFVPVRSMRHDLRENLWHIAVKHFGHNIPCQWKEQRKNSGAKWLELKGRFAGKRCFIIGNAPSVKQMDLTKLNAEYTFTCNKAFLLRGLGLEKSTFYTLSDVAFYKEFKENIDKNFAEYFFVSTRIPWDINVKNLFFFTPSGVPMGKGFFQLDMQRPVAIGYNVVIKILQIAVYLGFQEIIFIGVDLNFSKDNLHFYQSSEKELSRTPELKSVNKIMGGFEYAAKFLAQRGIKLYNASPEGVLDCMPRVKYDELF